VCPACKEIDSGRFPDYTELDAASNRGVDEVQSLLEQAVYKPVQGRFKVFMIDEVHMLTNTAFNAMLKTLEEPPEYLKFVLATTDPQKVPVTVLSRCLQFNLRPMAPETVLEHLTACWHRKRAGRASGAALLARAARGSMRDALSLTDQAIAFGSGQLQEATVRQMLGSVDRSHVFRLIDALAQGDGRTVVETVESCAQRCLGLGHAGRNVRRAAAHGRAAGRAADGRCGGPSDPEAAEMAGWPADAADETQLLYSICLHGRAELGLAPDEYAALTMALLRLLAFKPRQSRSGTAGKNSSETRHQAEAARIQAPAPAQASAQAVTVVAAEPVPAAPAVPEVAPVVPAAAPVQPPASVAPCRLRPWRLPSSTLRRPSRRQRLPGSLLRAPPRRLPMWCRLPHPWHPLQRRKPLLCNRTQRAAPQPAVVPPAGVPAVSNEVPPWEDIPEVAVEESDSSDDADSAPPAWEGPWTASPWTCRMIRWTPWNLWMLPRTAQRTRGAGYARHPRRWKFRPRHWAMSGMAW
jgi:DNA polymerase-3 subunit gamma/tau